MQGGEGVNWLWILRRLSCLLLLQTINAGDARAEGLSKGTGNSLERQQMAEAMVQLSRGP